MRTLRAFSGLHGTTAMSRIARIPGRIAGVPLLDWFQCWTEDFQLLVDGMLRAELACKCGPEGPTKGHTALSPKP